jgi:hypothetical protein
MPGLGCFGTVSDRTSGQARRQGVVCDMHNSFFLARVLLNVAYSQTMVMNTVTMPHFVHSGSVPDAS